MLRGRLASVALAATLLALIAASPSLGTPNPPHGHYFGSYLICDDGYKDVGGRCAALPSVTHGHYFGSYLICDDGYGDQGSRCVALPPVAHGHYFGAILLCDDGYSDSGGRCAKLPALPNGRYFGAVPLCDPGYSLTGPRCARSAGAPGGGIALCPSDSYAVAGRCFHVAASSYSTSRPTIPTTYVPPLCGENGSCYGDISDATGRPKTVYVRSYVRSDGTYVRSHFRSTPSFHFHP
jgi:hypothetical protein